MSFSHINKLVLIPLSLLLIQCNGALWKNPDETDWGNGTVSTPEAEKELDNYQDKIDFYYSSNPDSSIYYCHKLIDGYYAEKTTCRVFDAYNRLSEIYLQRKSDPVNALRYQAEALKLMEQNKWRETTNPFFYIDLGNIQLANNINHQAIESYQKSLKIAQKNKNNYAVSLSYNNLGIAFNKVIDYDSAIYYFNKALIIRKTLMPLLEAQSQVSLAQTFAEINLPDSLLYYQTAANNSIKRQKFTEDDLKLVGRSYSMELLRNINMDINELKAEYYKQTNHIDLAIVYYKQNIQPSFAQEKYLPAITALWSISELYQQLNERDSMLLYADSCYKIACQHKQFRYAIESAKLLAQCHANNNLPLSNTYLFQALSFNDSITRIEASEKKQNELALLLTTQAQDSLFYYQIKQDKNNAIVQLQMLSIIGLIVMLLVLGILIYIIINRQKLLKAEYLRLTEAMVKKIQEDDDMKAKSYNKKTASAVTEIRERLNDIMSTQKVFTQKNLSISELATLINTNVNYLSQIINTDLTTNYNDYLNELRVKEACRIMKNDVELKYSVDQIADMVGFSSRSTFYSAFKKFAGITPAFFQKNANNAFLQTK